MLRPTKLIGATLGAGALAVGSLAVAAPAQAVPFKDGVRSASIERAEPRHTPGLTNCRVTGEVAWSEYENRQTVRCDYVTTLGVVLPDATTYYRTVHN